MAAKVAKSTQQPKPGLISANGKDTTETVAESPEEKIRKLAYQKWEAAGMPLSDGEHFWLEAERELGKVPA